MAYMWKETNFKEVTFQWYNFKHIQEKNSNNLNSINDENNSNDENEDVSDKDEEIPENSTFHTDVADMLQVGEIVLIKADDSVHFLYLLYITKEQ